MTLTNIYIWWSTTSIEKKYGNAYTYRNVYSSRGFLKLLDRKDWKQVNPDSGKTWQARNGRTVWNMGVVSMPVNLPTNLKIP